MRKILITGALMLVLSACNHKSDNHSDKVMAVDMMMAPPAEKNYTPLIGNEIDHKAANLDGDTSKKLVKEGEISFETSNIKNTRKKILYSLTKLGGYLAEENETNNEGDRQNALILKLRVPSKNFDRLLDSLSLDAEKIDSKNITVKDVTGQYIDIKTALYNKQLLENRYRDLLKKANKISDVLQIENKLTEIRTAIDSTQGQLNYLNKQIAYSFLTINFYTRKLPQDTGYGVGYKLIAAIASGWGMLQDMFFGLIGLWPLILFSVILFILLKRWLKRRKVRKT